MTHDEPLVAGDPAQAIRLARRLFLDDRHEHGCAETTFVALKTAFGMDDAADASAAMALNGGVAYSGGMCGAISGAAIALGLLAGQRIADHVEAKRVARELTVELMDAFRAEFGAVDCRALVGADLRTRAEHDAFIASGIWRDRCMRQIELAVARLAPLGDDRAWHAAVTRLGIAATGADASLD